MNLVTDGHNAKTSLESRIANYISGNQVTFAAPGGTHTSNIRMTADVSSQHFHIENIQKGEQGTALTNPTGRLERARSRGVTNDKDGAANVSVQKPDPG